MAFDDADTELGRRRSIDEAVRLGDRRAADKGADRRRMAGQMFEKISDLGAMEHHGPTIEQEHPIERRAGEGDADEALRVGMPACPGSEEGEIDRPGDR